MKAKRFIAFLLCLSVVSFSLTGCGGNDASSQSSGTGSAEAGGQEKLTISIAYWQNSDYFPTGQPEDALTKEISDKLNITVKPVNVTWNDAEEKYKLWATTNDLPDVVSADGLGNRDTWNWQSQGVIRAVPEDLSKYPNVKKILDNAQAKALYKDGRYWGIPRLQHNDNKYVYENVVLMYKDVYDSLGLEKKPETMDEFVRMLELVKEKYPNKVPLTSHNIGWSFSPMINYNPYLGGNGWVQENGKWIPGFFSDKTLEGVKAMKPLWDEGLLDKDIFVNGNTYNGRDKFISGNAASIIYNAFPTALVTYATEWNQKHPDQNIADSVVYINMPKAPDGKYYLSVVHFWSESYFSSKVDDAKMDRILQLYDYLESPEGLMLRRYGIEGTDYTKSGDKITITRKKDDQGNYDSLLNIYKSMGMWQPLTGWDEDFPYQDQSIDPKILSFCNDWLQWKEDNTVLTPGYNITLQDLSTPTKDKFAYNTNNEDLATLLMSKGDLDSEWKQLMDKYKSEGYDKMVEEVNKAGKEAGLIS